MSDLTQRVQEEIAALRTLRDELRVRASLTVMEARDLWQDAEHKWKEIEAELERLGRVSATSKREIATALQGLTAALRKSYTALKTQL